MEEILARFRGDFLRIEPGVPGEICQQPAERLDVIALGGIAGEQLVSFAEPLQSGRPQGAGILRAKPLPVNHGARAGSWMITSQLQGDMCREKRVENLRPVEVVN